jgi:P-type Ca2+ transporter type 2C
MERRIPPALQDALLNTQGLSTAEAEKRFAQFGPNDIFGEQRHPWAQLTRDTAKDPMLWFLALTSLHVSRLHFNDWLLASAAALPSVLAAALLSQRRSAAPSISLQRSDR